MLKQAQAMACTLMEYIPLLSDPFLKLYCYEDVILNDANGASEMA
jgi:hypothetical protein